MNWTAVNTALALLRHAFGLVTREPLKTFSVVAPALALMIGVGVITATAAPELIGLDPANLELKNIKSAKLAIILLCTFILSYALMAILWHRHTLRSEQTPEPVTLGLLFSYIWRVIALSLIQMAAGLVIVIPLIIANNTDIGTTDSPAMHSMLITSFITQSVMLWLSLRLSLILPAAALGRPISMKHSWYFTRDLRRALWGVAAILTLINAGLTGLSTLLDLSQPLVALMLELPIYVIEGLIIFSVLTTLYAKQVQQREMDGL